MASIQNIPLGSHSNTKHSHMWPNWFCVLRIKVVYSDRFNTGSKPAIP